MNVPDIVFVRRWMIDGAAVAVGIVVAVVGVAAAASGVSALEEWLFRLINNLPDVLEPVMWTGQLLGVLVVPLGLAVVAAAFRRWRLAIGLALLAPAKLFVEYQVIKAVADRERPAASICDGDLDCLNLRNASAAGVSIPSGHAVIALGIWWLVAPYLSRRWQWTALAVCLFVPIARIYLGAHNPLDVLVGGAAGIAVAAALNLALGVPNQGSPIGRSEDEVPSGFV